MEKKRDEFLKPVRESLAKRVGYVCSYPECNKHTSGPSWTMTGSINIGVACHITAASVGGPRYDKNLTSTQRRSEENGIWLCQDHAHIIDNDKFYTVELLKTWKKIAEIKARENYLKPPKKQDLHISKYIKSFETVLNYSETKNKPLLDWPLIDQLERQNDGEIFYDNNNFNEIDKLISDPNSRKILISGAGGRGKTVLSRIYAYNKIQTGWLTYFIDIQEIALEDIDILLQDIEFLLNISDFPVLYIIENAHYSDEISTRLEGHIVSLLILYDNIHSIFISRDFIRDKDIDPFINWKKNGDHLKIIPTHEIIINIIESYINANRIEYKIDNDDINWISDKVSPINSQRNSSKNYGADLRLLRLYLDAWRESPKKLSLLEESDIIINLKRHLLIDELSMNVVLTDLLGKVASIFQFDIPYFARRRSYTDSRAYLKDLELLRNKGFIKFIGNDLYRLSHSLDASYVSKALADNSGTNHDEYTSKNILEYLKELPDTPKKHINKNIINLFKELYSYEYSHFKDQVFKYLFSDGRDFLKQFFISSPHNNIVLKHVLEAIEFHKGIEEAYSFWSDISSHLENDKFWHNFILENKPFHIATLMKTLKRITPDKNLADSINDILSDFKFIFINSDLLRLKEFFKYLPSKMVTQLLVKIDYETLAAKIIDSNPTNVSLLLKKLPDDYQKGLFDYIFNNEFDAFLEFFKKDKSKGYPKQLLDQIRNVDTIIEKEIRISLRDHFEDLRNQNRKRTKDGRLLINNKIANNYCNDKLSNENFLKWLDRNFENNFKVTINRFAIAKRLILKVHESTYGTAKSFKGGSIIKAIVFQLPEELIVEICYDHKLIKVIESSSKEAYNHISDIALKASS